MVKTRFNGHLIEWDYLRMKWLYSDTKQPIEENKDRPCPRCNRPPTKDGHDACLGELVDVKHACCGHGVEEGYVITNEGKKFWISDDLIELLNKK